MRYIIINTGVALTALLTMINITLGHEIQWWAIEIFVAYVLFDSVTRTLYYIAKYLKARQQMQMLQDIHQLTSITQDDWHNEDM